MQDVGQTMIVEECGAIFSLLSSSAQTLELGRLEQFGADERRQRVRNPHTAVGPLVVFQDGYQPAGGGQRAVERRGDLRLAILVPVARRQPSGLERGAVGRRGQLAVGAL